MNVSRNQDDHQNVLQITEKTLDYQQDAYGRLQRVENLMDKTIDIGSGTCLELKAQGEIISRSHVRLDNTQTNIQNTNKHTKKLLRGMLVDRISLCLALLIIAVSIAIIIVYCIKNKIIVI